MGHAAGGVLEFLRRMPMEEEVRRAGGWGDLGQSRAVRRAPLALALLLSRALPRPDWPLHCAPHIHTQVEHALTMPGGGVWHLGPGQVRVRKLAHAQTARSRGLQSCA